MDFKNYKCDACMHDFQDGDEIVSCPICGTPMHKNCYELAGKCIHENEHASGFDWYANKNESKPVEKKEEPTPTVSRAEQAVKNSIKNGEMPNIDDVIEDRIDKLCPGISDRQKTEKICDSNLGLVTAFIGTGVGKYIDKFRRIEKYNNRTFNWAAFLFFPYWFFYRKLYKIGIIYSTIVVCANIIIARIVEPISDIVASIDTSNFSGLTEAEMKEITTVFTPVWAIFLILFILHLVAGFTADRIYRKYIIKSTAEFEEMKRSTVGNENVLQFFIKKSAVNYWATMLCIFAMQFLPDLLLSIFK